MTPWSDIANFYRTLSARDGYAHLAPMVDLVEWLPSHAASEGLHPFTSHEQLCLSTTADRTAYLRLPFLTVVSTAEGEYLATFSAKPASSVRMKRYIARAQMQLEMPSMLMLLRRAAPEAP